MRSRLLLLGLVVALVLSATITVAVAQRWWTMAAAAGALLVSAGLLISADANRQARIVRRQLRRQARRSRIPAAVPAEVVTVDTQTPIQATPTDMLGAVRVLQAQYTARLDQLQASLDDAVEELRRENGQG